MSPGEIVQVVNELEPGHQQKIPHVDGGCQLVFYTFQCSQQVCDKLESVWLECVEENLQLLH